MPIDPWRPCNPDSGDHFLIFERRFRYLTRDPAHQLRVKWLPTVLECPVCQAEHGLRLALQESQDLLVQAQCHRGHTWPEPRVDRHWFTAYSRIRAGMGEAEDLWLTESGFGEEPPEPIDYLHQIKEGWTYGAKYVGRKAKNRVKAEVRRPVKKLKKKAANQAHRPVAAALRTVWGWQAGGTEPVKKPRPKKAPAPPKTPPVSAYRKAYGMDAPAKGPKCLVCEDTGRITGPGISIPCSECGDRPAPAPPAAKSGKKAGKSSGSVTVTDPGITVVGGDGVQVVNQTRGHEGGKESRRITREVNDAIDRAARSGGGRVNNGVVINGTNNSFVQNQVNERGGDNQVSSRATGGDE